MTNLDHHRRATAERPFEIISAGRHLHLADEIGSNGKKPLPFRRTTIGKLYHQAARG